MADQEQDDADALEGEHDGSYSEDGVRRPMNAFFIFCKRHRDVVREKYPHLENRSITKILGEWWANLDASEKSSYTALAKQYKEAFLKAHPDFKWYKLPTPPTRTLVTRPSNNRCLQSKKDKTVSRTSPCGIALGKLADEEQLGGLSSLITPPTSDSSSAPEIHDAPSSSSSSSQPTSSNNLLKPPKKRYLVNGEFKCHPESLESLTYDSRDHQTQNACSALLELAEICASSANHTSSASETSVTSNYQSLFDSLANTTSTSTLLSKPSVMLKDLTSSSAVSLPETSPQISGLSPHTKHFIKPVASLSSSMFPVSDSYVQQLQDQPLNLCKGKEKTFTARNQQLIDHFVDKFLCDSPSCPSTPSKPTLESSISDFTSARLPNLSKNPAVCQGFTLSAAIESAIDQAYSKDIPVSPKQSKSETEPTKTDDKAKEEIVFIDKIKKACLASSRNLTEKQTASINTLSTIKGTPQKAEPSDSKTEGALVNQTKESPTTTTTCVPDSSTSDVKLSTSSSFKREIKFISSSKYYSKFGSPPKKSRVWCNLFMKEQLKNSDGDGSLDEKSLMFDIASPVRRNSARTCKGRRYQALITEGLLQSSKERKGNAGKKPLPSNDKIKTRQSTSAESPPIKTKKKKRDTSDKNKSPPKEESTEGDKNIFNLNEKIASLPKCSIEMLNKKKKSSIDGVSSSKPSGNVSVSSAKKSSKAENNNDAKSNEASVQSQQNDSSSGRFKSGNFDLEQHIASLPKCDIEVLNKRRSKRE